MEGQSDHFLRLQYCLSESCQVLRDVFDQKSQNDSRPGAPFSDLETYLSFHKHTIRGLVRQKVLRQVQFDSLFPSAPLASPVTVKDMDISMLSALILNIFKPLPNMEEQWITDIRQTRNSLNHCGDITAMTDAEFSQYWKTLETNTNNLASSISAEYASNVSKAIKKMKDKKLTPSVQFLLEIINGLSSTNHDVIKKMEGELQELKRSTGKTESYMRNTIVVNKRKNDVPCKRMRIQEPRQEKMESTSKTLKKGYGGSNVLQNLKDQTKLYMKHCKPDDYFPEYDKAKNILLEKKIITINGPRLTGKTKLGVKLMSNYSEERCLVLQDPSDLKHVCLDDVSIILIDDVGGKYAPDREKTLRWYRKFDLLEIAVEAGKLNMIVITDSTTFDDCHVQTHSILSDVTTLTLSTSLKPETSSSSIGNENGGSLWNATFEKIDTVQIDIEDVGEFIFLPDGRCILDRNNEILTLMDSKLSKTLSRLLVNLGYGEICPVSNVQVLALGRRYLQFINVSTNKLALGRLVDLEDDVNCHSVDVVNDEIYILCTDREQTAYVRILDLHCQTKKQIVLDVFGFDEYDLDDDKIKAGKRGDKIFLLHPSGRKLICMSREGDVLFQVHSDNMRLDDFIEATYMYVDNNDNLLLFDDWRAKVYIISNDGTRHKVLDDFECDDSVLCYRESDDCLFVNNNKINAMTVYKVRT